MSAFFSSADSFVSGRLLIAEYLLFQRQFSRKYIVRKLKGRSGYNYILVNIIITRNYQQKCNFLVNISFVNQWLQLYFSKYIYYEKIANKNVIFSQIYRSQTSGYNYILQLLRENYQQKCNFLVNVSFVNLRVGVVIFASIFLSLSLGVIKKVRDIYILITSEVQQVQAQISERDLDDFQATQDFYIAIFFRFDNYNHTTFCNTKQSFNLVLQEIYIFSNIYFNHHNVSFIIHDQCIVCK
eukprot:TRINITY_DN3763_c0_g1_i2.p2 TRINITY_DN3763_c0_g1~~TRINITY_DN3763_c0_g1_i2.p2  ORF type:complete len:240 (-),score=-5.98 TRINITY_DN3763_c0_g1_i2:850-1569(-)